MSFHVEHRRQEREMNPRRFRVKRTIGEMCIQRPEPTRRGGSESDYEKIVLESKDLNLEASDAPLKRADSGVGLRAPSVGGGSRVASGVNKQASPFREIRVRQEAYDLNTDLFN